jgi:RNA-directed DNA polymerase
MDTQKEIQERFAGMKDKRDFLALINFVRPIVLPGTEKDFSQKQLSWFSSFKFHQSGKKYQSFEIRKKSGKTRTIHAPHAQLKYFQKCLNYILQQVYTPHRAATGFVPGKSIVDNARLHTNANYVYNLDLKDFFPSIDQARLRARLLQAPFQLNATEESRKIASIMALLCCAEMEVERYDTESGEWKKETKNVVPQGAPTSPAVSNIICEKLDRRLSGLARRFNLNYSRYADDITFSSSHNVYHQDGEFVQELHRIIADQNFAINPAKTRLQKRGYRQEVTGLVVNEKVNVNQKYIRQIRKWLYYWEQYGTEKASAIFISQYLADKGHVKSPAAKMQNVLWGKLEYLKMVKGAHHPTYHKLMERYLALTGMDIDSVLNTWSHDSIEAAMEEYYSMLNTVEA